MYIIIYVTWVFLSTVTGQDQIVVYVFYLRTISVLFFYLFCQYVNINLN